MATLPEAGGARRLVLIDPEEDATRSLGERLTMQGYTVSITTDPAEGARTSLADPPSAVVADLWMRGISGVQLCRLLKAEPATEHVPVILRGPDTPRNRFWAERAGASAYIIKGRMGDLVRALNAAIETAPEEEGFFTTFAGQDIRDRIAAHLDAALFESVIAAETRALGTCESFDRLFDLCSQFVSRVATYRWLAIATADPPRLAIHVKPEDREAAVAEARAALHVEADVPLLLVEDADARGGPLEGPPLCCPIELGGIRLGSLAMAIAEAGRAEEERLVRIIAREMAGPIRMAGLVETAQRLATTDALTGLMNRRAFLAALAREMAAADRSGEPLAVLVIDADHFKAINDRHGHGTGDAVLVAIARCIAQTVRSTDLAARHGGEEFVVALREASETGAQVVTERLRQAIAAIEVISSAGLPVGVTASSGLTLYRPGDSLDAVIERADRALYEAKRAGRDRVVFDPGRPHDPAAPEPHRAVPAPLRATAS